MVGWGINPTAMRMVGTQGLLAFRQSNGSMFVNTYNDTSEGGESPLVISSLSYPVSNLSSKYHRSSIIIYANPKGTHLYKSQHLDYEGALLHLSHMDGEFVEKRDRHVDEKMWKYKHHTTHAKRHNICEKKDDDKALPV